MMGIRRRLWILPVLVAASVAGAWWFGEDDVEFDPVLQDPEELTRLLDGGGDGGSKGSPQEKGGDDPKGDDQAPKLPPDWWEGYPAKKHLEAGEVVTRSETQGKMRINRAEGLIDAAPEDVYATVTDYEAYPEFMPDTVVCRVDSEDGRKRQVHQEIEVAFKRVRYDILIEHREDGLGTSWHQTGGDLEVNEGSWTIIPIGPKQSLAIYRLRVVPGFWIPQSIADRLMRRSLPGVIEAVRKRATQE